MHTETPNFLYFVIVGCHSILERVLRYVILEAQCLFHIVAKNSLQITGPIFFLFRLKRKLREENVGRPLGHLNTRGLE